VSYACSLEQIGPITRDVTDAAMLLSIISGKDPNDSTTLPIEATDYTAFLDGNVDGLKIGVIREFMGEGIDKKVSKAIWDAVYTFEKLGASWEEVSLPNLVYSIPTYYIIAMSEASSNLARYDGVRYGYRADAFGDWVEVFSETRSKGFGEEVIRRIILGTFALTAGYFDQYYLKASKVRTLIVNDFKHAFKKFSVLVGPTSPIPPFKIGEMITDPLQMYLIDLCTTAINLAGVPAISIPCNKTVDPPIGLQIIGDQLNEGLILKTAYAYERTYLEKS